jgi:hypothetical protein
MFRHSRYSYGCTQQQVEMSTESLTLLCLPSTATTFAAAAAAAAAAVLV